MKTAGVRFNKEVYLNVSMEDDAISLYTVDADGNKTEYTVTKTSKRKSKNTEEK